MKTISLLRLQARSWYRLTLILCALTFAFGNAWADPDHSYNESWNFAATSGNSNWTGTGGKYCNAYGQKSSDWYITKNNISNFSSVNFSSHENVSVTIYVSAGTNGGTNSYVVKLVDSNGSQVSTYSSPVSNELASSQSGAATVRESSVTFTPTSAFAGYRVEFKSKAYMTQTRYVLTYDDKAAVSCSNKVTVTTVASGNGSFF